MYVTSQYSLFISKDENSLKSKYVNLSIKEDDEKITLIQSIINPLAALLFELERNHKQCFICNCSLYGIIWATLKIIIIKTYNKNKLVWSGCIGRYTQSFSSYLISKKTKWSHWIFLTWLLYIIIKLFPTFLFNIYSSVSYTKATTSPWQPTKLIVMTHATFIVTLNNNSHANFHLAYDKK